MQRALSLASVGAHDGPCTQMVAFGDSQSDNGNAFIVTWGAQPVFPFLPGRFSDGLVRVESLAAALRLAALALPWQPA